MMFLGSRLAMTTVRSDDSRGDPSLVTVDEATRSPLSAKICRIFRIVFHFFLGQGALQGINVIIGIFLIRVLSVNDYAKFGLASGFQATTSILMDLGCASTIIPLVGDRALDPLIVGRYVRGAKSLRDTAFWVLSPFAAIVFLIITYRQKWPWPIQITLLMTVLLALYSSGPVSYYSAPLFLHRRLRAYYVPQTISNICRLGAYVVLSVLGALNSWTAAGLSALNITLNGQLLGRRSRHFFTWPQTNDLSIQKEIGRYILPASPAIILGAFHGQIALFLISIFGNTVSIAEVAALGRLGLIFNFLMTFNIVIVEPYIARLQRRRLLLTYFRLIFFAALCCAGLVLFSFAVPTVFLWLLGPKYGDLRGLIGWVVLTACINYVAGLIWIMNRSRKWVFWRGTIAEIGLLLLVQVGYVIVFGVRSTRDAVMFNLASSFCYVFAHSYVAVYGFLKKQENTVAVLAPDPPIAD
jgi:O-antigen/teichoic acid export membrane protein